MSGPTYECPVCEGSVAIPSRVWYGPDDHLDCPNCGAHLVFDADGDDGKDASALRAVPGTIWHGLRIEVTASGAHVREVVEPRLFADFLRDRGRPALEIERAVQGRISEPTRAWVEIRHDAELCESEQRWRPDY